jgi:DNA polymerase III subunit delta'
MRNITASIIARLPMPTQNLLHVFCFEPAARPGVDCRIMAMENPSPHTLPDLLRRSLETGRLGHAYLLTGDELGPLETIARRLAQSLNCQHPPTRYPSGWPVQPCLECSVCRRIQDDQHPDVQWTRPESKMRVVTIDQMRQLLHTIHLKAHEAVCKVAVLVAADRLNSQAANAFLKTLEEPPPGTHFLLLTTEPQRVLATIRSRCLPVNCGLGSGPIVSAPDLDFLKEFANLAATPDAANLLGRYRLLGLVLDKLAQARKDVETTLTADSPLERYEDIDPKLRDKWEDELSAAVEAEYRLRRVQLLSALQSWLRDVWLAAQGHDPDLFFFADLSALSRQIAGRLDVGSAQENLHIINRTQRLLFTNVQEALALEVGLLKLSL